MFRLLNKIKLPLILLIIISVQKSFSQSASEFITIFSDLKKADVHGSYYQIEKYDAFNFENLEGIIESSKQNKGEFVLCYSDIKLRKIQFFKDYMPAYECELFYYNSIVFVSINYNMRNSEMNSRSCYHLDNSMLIVKNNQVFLMDYRNDLNEAGKKPRLIYRLRPDLKLQYGLLYSSDGLVYSEFSHYEDGVKETKCAQKNVQSYSIEHFDLFFSKGGKLRKNEFSVCLECEITSVSNERLYPLAFLRGSHKFKVIK